MAKLRTLSAKAWADHILTVRTEFFFSPVNHDATVRASNVKNCFVDHRDGYEPSTDPRGTRAQKKIVEVVKFSSTAQIKFVFRGDLLAFYPDIPEQI